MTKTKETNLTYEPSELRRMTDEELIRAYREGKTETAGLDPELAPPGDEAVGGIRDEMNRRGLTPDREDIIPDLESPESDPVVEDRA